MNTEQVRADLEAWASEFFEMHTAFIGAFFVLRHAIHKSIMSTATRERK